MFMSIQGKYSKGRENFLYPRIENVDQQERRVLFADLRHGRTLNGLYGNYASCKTHVRSCNISNWPYKPFPGSCGGCFHFHYGRLI